MAETPRVRSHSPATGPHLVPLGHHEGKPPIALVRPVIVIGSRSNARIHLVSSTVSKAHALLVRSGGRWYIRDLASRTKVIINGQPVRETVLEDGDEITIGKFFFRFRAGTTPASAAPSPAAAPAKLEVAGAEFPVPIDERVALIGRRGSADIPLVEDSVSTAHAVIFEMDGQRFIRDLGSRTGTFVNNVSTHQHQLSPGDTIRIGDTVMRYALNEIGPATVVDEDAFAIDVDEPRIPAAAPALEEPPAGGVEPASLAPAPAEEPVESREPLAIESEAPAVAPADDEAIPLAESVDQASPPIAPASVDIAGAAAALSEAPALSHESLSEPAPDADKHVEAPIDTVASGDSVAIEPDVAGELPRRGWHSPAAEWTASEEPPQADESDDVLKFPDSIPSSDDANVIDLGEGVSATAVVDQSALDTPPAPIGDGAATDLPLSDDELVDLIAPPPPAKPFKPISIALELPEEPAPSLNLVDQPAITPDEDQSTTAPPMLDLAEGPAVPPALETPPDDVPASTPHEDSPRPLIAAVELPPAPAAGAPRPAEPTPPVLEPPAEVVEQPAEAADEKPKKRRGRKKKEPVIKEMPATLEVPAEPVVESPITPAAEVIEPTEPTRESALDSAARLLEIEIAAPTEVVESGLEVDPLTDTSFGRAVADFTGSKSGEIVEDTPGALTATPIEIARTDSPATADAPTHVADQGDATPAATEFEELLDQTLALEPAMPPDLAAPADLVLPLEPPPAAHREPVVESRAEPSSAEQPKPDGPRPAQVPWGANQDNFLGGRPLDLIEPPAATPSLEADEAVKDLISEIDHAAAAAEAASAPPPPPAGDDLPPIIPAIPVPPRPRNLAPRRRKVHDEDVAPLNLTGGADQPVKPNFDGLGMSGIREMDVFSQMSPPVVEQPANEPSPPDDSDGSISPRRQRGSLAGHFRAPAGTYITADAEPPETASRLKVVPEIPADVNGALVGEKPPQVAFAVEQTEAEAAAIRRKYFRRAAGLMATMLLLIGAAAYAIHNFVGISTTVEGSLSYLNLAALTNLERQRFQVEQYRILKDETTQALARRILNQRWPEVSYGPLENRKDYLRLVERASFTDQRPEALTVRMEGSNPAGDQARTMAILLAMYQQGQTYADQAKAMRSTLDQLDREITSARRQVDDLSAEISKLRMLGETRPSAQQIAQLEQVVDALEKKWTDAVAAVKAADVELAQLRAAPAGDVPPGEAAPAPADQDEKIKAMQSELAKLQEQVTATRSENATRAAEARKQLDAALEAFQKRVAEAQGSMNSSPEVAAFVQAAQKLQETTRQLTDDLIRRQEQQFGRLMSLKDSLNDKMEQRRIESWQNDKQLQDLTEQLAILTRKYNAALGGGLQKESDDLKVEIDLTNNMIKARRDLLPGDSFYADAIKQLQVVIDSTQKNIEEDRKKTEALLTTLQQSFTSSESIEKLPAEQKQLAEALQKQLEQINQARQEYNQAADRGAADADAQLKQQIATLQAGIDARRHALAEENVKSLKSQQEQTRLDAIAARQKELASLNEAEATARKAFFDKHKELRDAQNQVAEAKNNADRLDALIRQKDIAQRDLSGKIAQQELKTREVARAVEPIQPTDKDISVRTGQDMRLTYTLASGGSILLVFLGLILWTLHTASREAPGLNLQAADLGPATDKPANGHEVAKSGNGTEEDHQPAVV